MTLPTLSPAEARRLIDDGAILVDVREADEHARERIPGARHHALSRLFASGVNAGDAPAVIFHCRSGARTAGAAVALKDAAGCDAYILAGGLDAWRKAGLPVASDRSQPIEIMRQVQIAAGSLVLVGVLMGLFVAPGWYGLAGFVGAGLVFAGISGTCAMARLLGLAPWNRRATAAMKAA